MVAEPAAKRAQEACWRRSWHLAYPSRVLPVKPSAQPTQVRTLHLPPRKSPGQARCALSRRAVLRHMGRSGSAGARSGVFPGQGIAAQASGSGRWAAAVEEWLDTASSRPRDWGDSRPSCGGREIAQVGRAARMRGGIWLVCRSAVLAGVSEPSPLPVRPFENAQIAD